MKPDVVEKLGDARDFCGLTKAVLALCDFRPRTPSASCTNRGASTVACLVELESAKQHAALARLLGTRVLNGAVCLEVPVQRDFGAARRRVVAVAPGARLPQQPAARTANTQASA